MIDGAKGFNQKYHVTYQIAVCFFLKFLPKV